MLRAAVVIPVLAGCSFLANAPPRSYVPANGTPDCGLSGVALGVDATLAVGGLGFLFALSTAGEIPNFFAPAVLVASTPWVVSSFVGIRKRQRCRIARRLLAGDLDAIVKTVSSRMPASASVRGSVLHLERARGTAPLTCDDGRVSIVVLPHVQGLRAAGVHTVECVVDEVVTFRMTLSSDEAR